MSVINIYIYIKIYMIEFSSLFKEPSPAALTRSRDSLSVKKTVNWFTLDKVKLISWINNKQETYLLYDTAWNELEPWTSLLSVDPEGLEPLTSSLQMKRSSQLS